MTAIAGSGSVACGELAMAKERPRRQESWDESPKAQSYMDFWAALHMPLHSEILALLTTGPRNVSTIADDTGKRKSQVSKRLGELWNSGFVEFSREKQCRIYRIQRDVSVQLKDGAVHIRANATNGDHLDLEIHLGAEFLKRNGQSTK